MTRKYEMLYILRPSLSDEELAAAKERIHTLVSSNGTIAQVDNWGRKRLAYEIDDHKEGNYELIEFTAEGTAPKEIERIMNIMDQVLRFLVVRQQEA